MDVKSYNNAFICNEARSVIRSHFFPNFKDGGNEFKNSFLLGIGGNVGDTKKRFELFLYKLKKDRRFFVKECSLILKNKAFGYTKQADFLNAVLLVKSSFYAADVLKIMQHYEKIFGRIRSFRNAPRTLDIDILYFDKKIRNSQRLILPHPGANDRLSVIIPIGSMKGI
ncbi:2-amino-4-hydroxy-6-hydroxymethyldihydropteridinepyrophosphokinase [Campylobacter hyointestinalis]|uniref:2-amino-4-hydroxy-6-hydroxymethyldihydropteridine pyrophosphokinase n=1 Tax=Campylobacter hyointestinalis subsp. hyointestinalis TaxID=91352 RepID=A0A855N849_CAMHY|nr:2-amino-4-hydroxy-6-hydroxymethyldihydropteridine diphosphokinase [Campylobacter hyointestinalis]MBT0611250.1 2-amino-4-hydroxy-6-hydroxymethyldihydropteridine diphosphokinase [Campylobacter hyointestinalis subsp. hyointestinalis]MDY2998334.1 2-amino-4-hydroxy-6-hydroxymethyldihydropteridine diphosphokinase [Campylobacter hyointestinalis]PPB58265.1 2-amino-4-hydroxy-6-hydroxymethyldihydropteridine diphosphokinase [Campylobacter hyointestinalis subsp. hyointestinalis]PPB59727.1 2-amino-4-hydr